MVLTYAIGGALVIALLGALFYWQLIVAEGAYLGQRTVILLYDWFAPRYDKVKGFQPQLDARMLTAPILQHLLRHEVHQPQVLDVATGTGRLPQALLAAHTFEGHITALDLSARMLAQAQAKLAPRSERISWLQHDAQILPFPDESFDVVTCLESLEFFPCPPDAIREMARVLKTEGLLVISNRIGPDAWKLPGRTLSTAACAETLAQLGLRDIQTVAWLVDYDLLRALK
ncbi:MAG TPA: class I SAM-dependent methyltransferase [Anaerolineae bacterium]